jgi:glycosyltransferase involved in cell wall biosynthesis
MEQYKQNSSDVGGALWISCVIPTLNRGKVVLDTIQMLLAQDCGAPEVAVVGQTPNLDEETRRKLRNWHALGKSRQLEPKARKARNVGALAASGNVPRFTLTKNKTT